MYGYSIAYVRTQQLLFNVVELTHSYCLLYALVVINDSHFSLPQPRTEIKTLDTNLISQVAACLCNLFYVITDSSKRSFINFVYLCP